MEFGIRGGRRHRSISRRWPRRRDRFVDIEFNRTMNELARALVSQALDYRHDLPVLTVLVLLCKEANSPDLTGTYQRNLPDGWQTNRYNYRVVRLWQDDPELYLTRGCRAGPAGTTRRRERAGPPRPGPAHGRSDQPGAGSRAAKLWTATCLLMGLRYSEELTMSLLEGVQIMHQSTTYERILREGREEGREEGLVTEARRFLVRLGTQQFGEPDPTTAAALEAIQDVDRLESLGERILRPDLKSWEELFAKTTWKAQLCGGIASSMYLSAVHDATVRQSESASSIEGRADVPMKRLSIAESLREGIAEEMRRDPAVFCLGEDIAVPGGWGGAFTVTLGLEQEFPDRMLNTPIAELGFFGAAVGAAIMGMRPIVDVQYGDFLFLAMDQIVNNAAKLRYMSGGTIKVPLVMRAPIGATGRGSQHAQSMERYFTGVPGIKVVAVSNAYDAKGILKSAVRDDNPVLIFEHKLLYGSKGARTEPGAVDATSDIPDGDYTVPLDRAAVRRAGQGRDRSSPGC